MIDVVVPLCKTKIKKESVMKRKYSISLGIFLVLACLGTGVSGFNAMKVSAEAQQFEVNFTKNRAKTLENTQNGVRCRAKSAYLMDYGTETVLFSKN